MYERRNRESNSSYFPSFLYLSLDSPENIEQLFEAGFDERTTALFVHEYTHFMQDITTYSGLIEITTKLDRFKWAIIEAAKQKELDIPFNPSTEQSYHIADNYSAQTVADGSGLGNGVQIKKILQFRLETATLTDNKRKIEKNIKAFLLFETPQGERKSYNVGAYAISESMAYLMEQTLYPDIISDPEDCPYHIVEKIIHHYIPQYENKQSMIAICDVCLQTPFPGATFCNIIQLLKKRWEHKNSHTFYSPEDIIEKIGLSHHFLMRNNIHNVWPNYLNEKGREACKQLQDFFNSDYWKGNKDLVGQILSHAIDYRIKNPLLMLDIAKGGNIHDNAALIGFYSACGIPCIVNANNEVFKVIPQYCAHLDVEPELFVNLNSVHEILLTEKVSNNHNLCKCPLINHCHMSYEKKIQDGNTTPMPTDLTVKEDDFCKQAPWNNNYAPEGLNNCSFARLWATYGLPTITLGF